MIKKIYWLIFSIALLSSEVSGQASSISTISELEAEVENLRLIQQALRAELASLQLLAKTKSRTAPISLPRGYYARFPGYEPIYLPEGLRIEYTRVGKKYVYSIVGFADPHTAFRLAQQLRQLSLTVPDYVYKTGSTEQPTISSTSNKKSGSMEIE